jgi:hypothetical protein
MSSGSIKMAMPQIRRGAEMVGLRWSEDGQRWEKSGKGVTQSSRQGNQRELASHTTGGWARREVEGQEKMDDERRRRWRK